MNERVMLLSKALIQYAMTHGDNLPDANFHVVDNNNCIHEIKFWRTDIMYSSAQHDDIYSYYFECKSLLNEESAKCWHPEIDWQKYDLTANYTNKLLFEEVLELAVRHINELDGCDYVEIVRILEERRGIGLA